MIPCLLLKQFLSLEVRKTRKRVTDYFNKTYELKYKASSVRLVDYHKDKMKFLVFYKVYVPSLKNYYSDRPAQCFVLVYKFKQGGEIIQFNLNETDARRDDVQ